MNGQRGARRGSASGGRAVGTSSDGPDQLAPHWPLWARSFPSGQRAFALDHADRLLDVAHKTFGKQLGRLLWNEPGPASESIPITCTTSAQPAGGFGPRSTSQSRDSPRRFARIWVGSCGGSGALGRVRDLDVAIARVSALDAEATPFERPAFRIFAQGLSVRRAARRIEMIERPDSERFRTVVSQARAWIEAGPPAAAFVPEGVAPAYAIAPRIIAHWAKGMREAYERAEQTMEEPDLHALRIAAKKARYAIEYFAELDGPGRYAARGASPRSRTSRRPPRRVASPQPDEEVRANGAEEGPRAGDGSGERSGAPRAGRADPAWRPQAGVGAGSKGRGVTIHVLRGQATREQVKEMLEALEDYVKLAVDIRREIAAGGGIFHADCEVVLLEDGSQQEDIWALIGSQRRRRYATKH